MFALKALAGPYHRVYHTPHPNKHREEIAHVCFPSACDAASIAPSQLSPALLCAAYLACRCLDAGHRPGMACEPSDRIAILAWDGCSGPVAAGPAALTASRGGCRPCAK